MEALPASPAPAIAAVRGELVRGPVGPGPVDEVGGLITSDSWVRPDERVADVAERFFHAPALEAVALVRAGRPAGLLTRGRLLVKLARGFGYELYARKPVSRIADPDPLVLPGQTALAEAIARALDREPARVYEEIVVVDGAGRYLGLLPVRDLVLQQSVACARADADREAAQARAADLERLEHLRAQFLAHATHELRSPVNAIAALAELLHQAAERADVGALRERLGLLQQCTAGLRTTVNNLLDLSRLEAGKAELVASPVALGPALEDVAATTRLLLGAKPVAVHVEAPAGLELSTDPQKLRQVLVNLASNAAKFTERGQVVLAAAAAQGGGVRLWVRDSGCGIAPEDLDRLFVPFGQLEDAFAKAHEGSGLGLVITRSLVTILGGRVEVRSAPGAGSTFTVHLPATPPRSPQR